MAGQSNLLIKQMEIGPLQNFIYFVGDKTANKIAVIDPAWDVDFLLTEAKKDQLEIVAVFLTHGHPDHVNGLDELLSTHPVPVYISQYEADYYTPQCKGLKKVDNGEQLAVGNVTFECIHTPGHTPGGQCFLSEGHLIAGDTIFIDGCGRCDLPGGDARILYNSLFNVIQKMPDETVIYPGHNYGPTPTDTIGHQKQTNPYLICSSVEEFLQNRMGLSI